MKVLMVMNEIESINPKKDSSLALMLEAQRRGYQIDYCLAEHLHLVNGMAYTNAREVEVASSLTEWFSYKEDWTTKACQDYNIIWMRTDPPFDLRYLYATLILEHAQASGCIVVNSPRVLRDLNEKMAIHWFPSLIPQSLVSSHYPLLMAFIEQHKKVVLKPLHVMAGTGIYLVERQGPNVKVILETITDNFTTPIMAQAFIPAVKKGDKRVMMIDGEPFQYGLKRIPQKGEFRANLAQGGTGEPFELDSKTMQFAQQLSPVLKEKGVIFAGIDLIGDYLTEINVTSPTCIQEIDAGFGVNISDIIWQAIEKRL